ncbi:hypothetical protein FA10DRAFT_87645 [Acaromyces ingoldii]|uniref:Uncharacterized protein n=1 Tax=Acaromyces ingoldii TaxID=215250 RepID=A0A316YSN7_9BASI|nr:hypothetical protein FA10DRAFT_87645 [Acaromyces ingoldii]PWN92251.1 hypothetical protein FA10DRAFT_87645 [Acaromyces ingoldii]
MMDLVATRIYPMAYIEEHMLKRNDGLSDAHNEEDERALEAKWMEDREKAKHAVAREMGEDLSKLERVVRILEDELESFEDKIMVSGESSFLQSFHLPVPSHVRHFQRAQRSARESWTRCSSLRRLRATSKCLTRFQPLRPWHTSATAVPSIYTSTRWSRRRTRSVHLARSGAFASSASGTCSPAMWQSSSKVVEVLKRQGSRLWSLVRA